MTLQVSIVQPEITWHQVEANFDHISSLISGIDETDVIVLPEMWSSGFTMKAHTYHKQTEQAVQMMMDWSERYNCCVIGSLITKVGEDYYNRLYVVVDQEIKATYDKKHLFAHSGEDRFYKSGKERCIYDYKGWKLSLNVCYDLRFPVWCRNVEDYDIAIYVANWPEQRIKAWDTLLQSRAIENQCYVIGSNCYGKDVWHNNYVGHSAVISYTGDRMIYSENEASLLSIDLSKENLLQFRQQLPFLKDRDAFRFT